MHYFLHKIFKNFMGRGNTPFPDPITDPSAPLSFQIFGSATVYVCYIGLSFVVFVISV